MPTTVTTTNSFGYPVTTTELITTTFTTTSVRVTEVPITFISTQTETLVSISRVPTTVPTTEVSTTRETVFEPSIQTHIQLQHPSPRSRTGKDGKLPALQLPTSILLLNRHHPILHECTHYNRRFYERIYLRSWIAHKYRHANRDHVLPGNDNHNPTSVDSNFYTRWHANNFHVTC